MTDLTSLDDILPVTAEERAGQLNIGGCNAVELAEEFGTPLFVFCEETFRRRAHGFRSAFAGSSIYYAAKAFFCLPLSRLLEAEGLGLDVASGGELHTALVAGFPAERMIFHGNNKLDDDLTRAVEAGIGRIAIDSLEEIERVAETAGRARRQQPVVVRVTPGVEAHTHEYIQTGQEDSKFGLSIQSGAAGKAIDAVLRHESLELAGLHAHIGSNIFSADPFEKTIEVMMRFWAEAGAQSGGDLSELNLGGGFGIRQVPGDDPAELDELATRITKSVKEEAQRHGLAAPGLAFEPGRSIVANAMVTLYRVGTIKHLEEIRTYVSVDGGMSDNIRPALYGAQYTAILANKTAESKPTRPVTLAGVHCESGDVLIKDVPMPGSIRRGDLVAVPATGAYNYSMASNYNKQPRPAVVSVREGNARLLIRRETFDDLLRLDEPPG